MASVGQWFVKTGWGPQVCGPITKVTGKLVYWVEKGMSRQRQEPVSEIPFFGTEAQCQVLSQKLSSELGDQQRRRRDMAQQHADRIQRILADTRAAAIIEASPDAEVGA